MIDDFESCDDLGGRCLVLKHAVGGNTVTRIVPYERIAEVAYYPDDTPIKFEETPT